ncbi:multifunctional CCA addition/repair protein [Celerinatantimonas sp. YJH-8]|uniref:multifunctional CCA addition/repair protein n=1 Tax=Celerinatantimonas sp. YJH-8 TaxID=3228714 RepID=UPI0038C824F4
MQIYLVGGAVRDQLLDLPVHDCDYVVVHATPEQMIQQGYTQVGKSFPVFLHPKTGEEYALARTERKTGTGYTGFECQFGPEVSLETDLQRRDLTINAMAQASDGTIIDPFGGQFDLEHRLLRHVSHAFEEDPLRVLRVARFAARFAHLGFTIADETLQLMAQMATSGELDSLTPERIYKELEKALQSPSPQVFIEVLRQVGALTIIFPEIQNLFGVPAPAHWHPEIDSGIHTLLTLSQATQLSDRVEVRFAALCHDLGKALTPRENWPSHKGHDLRGVPLVEQLCDRLKVPNHCRELAVLCCRWHIQIHKQGELEPTQILDILDGCDAWRKPQRFEAILQVCHADIRGRRGHEQDTYPQAGLMQHYLQTLSQIPIQPIVAAGFKGVQIREQLRAQRLLQLEHIHASGDDARQ